MLLAAKFFEDLAMMLIGGCCAAAWLSSFIFIRLLGIGECPVISGIIGAAIGTGSLFVLQIDSLWLSMVISAVVTLVAGIVLNKTVYGSTSADAGASKTEHSSSPGSMWICSCGAKNPSGNRFCRSCGKSAGVDTTSALGSANDRAPKDSWVCSCGKRNPNSEAMCKNCGKLNTADMWVCKCGHKNLSNAKFCKKCGTKRAPVRIITEKSKATTWVCPKCKKINPNTSRVCKDCGYEK